MKEFHILTVGNSLISNFQKVNPQIRDVKMGDEGFWEAKYRDRSFFLSLLDFLREDPHRHSAETNSLLHYSRERKIKLQDISVYLSGTKTASNNIVLNVLMAYLKELQVEVYSPKEVQGLPLSSHEDLIVKEFERDISNLLDTFLILARRKKQEGYRVVFNPTGGYKPHVIVCAFAGFLTQSEIYYIHEELNQLVIIPPLFYFPRHGEFELLEKLERGKSPLKGKDFEKILSLYPHAVERLAEYGLVELEAKPGQPPFGIKITSKGKWAIDYYRQMTEIDVNVK